MSSAVSRCTPQFLSPPAAPSATAIQRILDLGLQAEVPLGGGNTPSCSARPLAELTPLLHIGLHFGHCIAPQTGAPALALQPAGLGQTLAGAVGRARRREWHPRAPHSANFLHDCCPVRAVRKQRGAGACTL